MSRRETDLIANKHRIRSHNYFLFAICIDITVVLFHSKGVLPIDSKMVFPIVAVNVIFFGLSYITRKKEKADERW